MHFSNHQNNLQVELTDLGIPLSAEKVDLNCNAM